MRNIHVLTGGRWYVNGRHLLGMSRQCLASTEAFLKYFKTYGVELDSIGRDLALSLAIEYGLLDKKQAECIALSFSLKA